MNKKKLITLVVALLVVVILVILILLNPKDNKELEKNNVDTDPVSEIDSQAANMKDRIELITGEESVEVFSEVLDIIPLVAEAPRAEIVENSAQEIKTVNLAISEAGFSPKTFKAKTGQVININLGVVDQNTHAFNFTDVELIASDVTVTPGYSLGFNIVAPLEAGSYSFHDALFPENTGKMIIE